ncbi:MAG: SAM-dependent methyltransferase [Sciscionella sp.]
MHRIGGSPLLSVGHEEVRQQQAGKRSADGLARLDLQRANPARMYDYYLGGAHNLAVDRATADRALAASPEIRTFAHENRAFLNRVVRYLVRDAGITQFLDLGSGIPTVGNVHEIAQNSNGDAKVVYVDHEPVAIGATRRLLAGNPNATIINADLRYPHDVLSHPETKRLLDFTRPVAVLMVSVLAFVPDADDPNGIVAAYRTACAPGSYLALSHGLTIDYWSYGTEHAIELYASTTHPLHPRRPEQVAALFAGYRMVEPGLVITSVWRPERPSSDQVHITRHSVAGLGRLPDPAPDGAGPR